MTRLLHPVQEAWEIIGIGRTMLYELIAKGEIKTVKIGRRTLIAHDELARYVASLSSDGAA
jgi:excisionase family DNA binding protein